MKFLTASDAKNHFGAFLDEALAGAVMVRKSGRDVAVMMSAQEYRRLREAEENYNLMLALQAERDRGALSVEESNAVLDAIIEGTYKGDPKKA